MEQPSAADSIKFKRIFVDLNPDDDSAITEAVKKWGGHRLVYKRFGAVTQPQADLLFVKTLLREGRVVWLRATFRREHIPNAKGIAQCCRMAHRAGVPWSVRIAITGHGRYQP